MPPTTMASASLLAELEDMVSKTTVTASYDDDDTNNASEVEVEVAVRRWRRLFGFTRDEAAAKIEAWRGDWKRNIVSQDLWEEVREEMERDGFDKEAYEFSLSLEGCEAAWLTGLLPREGEMKRERT